MLWAPELSLTRLPAPMQTHRRAGDDAGVQFEGVCHRPLSGPVKRIDPAQANIQPARRFSTRSRIEDGDLRYPFRLEVGRRDARGEEGTLMKSLRAASIQPHLGAWMKSAPLTESVSLAYRQRRSKGTVTRYAAPGCARSVESADSTTPHVDIGDKLAVDPDTHPVGIERGPRVISPAVSTHPVGEK